MCVCQKLSCFGQFWSPFLISIHLANWVEDCHLWLDWEEKTLAIANPPEIAQICFKYFLRPNSIFWHRQCPKVKVYSWQWQCTKVKVWVLSQSTLIKCFMICTEMRSLNTIMKSYKQISSPALSVNPACGSVGAKNVAFCVLSKKIWIIFFFTILQQTFITSMVGPL